MITVYNFRRGTSGSADTSGDTFAARVERGGHRATTIGPVKRAATFPDVSTALSEETGRIGRSGAGASHGEDGWGKLKRRSGVFSRDRRPGQRGGDREW